MSDVRRVVIAGGSGLIGTALVRQLLSSGYEPVVLTRRPESLKTLPAGARAVGWDGRSVGDWSDEVDGARAVVNLVGAGVADKRWSPARKEVLLRSRVEPTRALAEAIRRAKSPPEVLLQGSAVGFYGSGAPAGSAVGESHRVSDLSPSGDDFLARLTVEWEAAAVPVEKLGVRLAFLRTGLVLDPSGGALAKMLPAIKAGVGGRLGSGEQAMPWIHHVDEVGAIAFLLEAENLSGPVLLVAPHPVSNGEFIKAVGQRLHRPTLLPVPAFALKLLLGELAQALLVGQWASPDRLLEAGYKFQFPELRQALEDLL